MRFVIDLSLTPEERRALRQRLGPLIVVVLIHILGVIGLITLAPEYNPLKKADRDLTLIDLKEPPPPPPQKKAREVVARPKAGGALRKAPQPTGPPPPLNMVVMDSRTFAQTSIGGLPQQSNAGPVVAANEGTPKGDGKGPAGAEVFGVDWYREPTSAQLDTYFRKALTFLQKNELGQGWGTVVCRTAPGYRVEDCHELDESPAHSGFARAVREASWQFQVVPRRVGNKAMIGEWVFVTIEFTLTGARMASGGSAPSIDPAKLRAWKTSVDRSSPRVYGPSQ